MLETVIQISLLKILKPLTYFEFGTYLGINALNMAMNMSEGFDLAPIRRALNSCVNIFNLYGCF